MHVARKSRTVQRLLAGLGLLVVLGAGGPARARSFFIDSPDLSQLPTDGSPIQLTLFFEMGLGEGILFFLYEVHTVGDIVIEDWDGRTSFTCRNTPNLCALESETEFLGTRDASISGLGGRGSTGFDSRGSPWEIGTITYRRRV